MIIPTSAAFLPVRHRHETMVGMTVTDDAACATAPPAAYWRRREEIASHAAGLEAEPAEIDYHAVEDRTWASVSTALAPRWERTAASEVIAARK